MQRAKTILTGFLLLTSLLLAACGPAAIAPQPASTLKVLAAETFLADIAQNVAGERVKVESLLPIGLDPHTFEPTPQDVKRIAESNVLILNGSGFEVWAEKVLENAGGQQLVIEASAGLTMRQPQASEATHAHEEETHDDHSVESHSQMVCAQLEGKQATATVQAGQSAETAAELHHGEEHTHEREIITLQLHRQPNGMYGGFVTFHAETEEGYAFTSGAGTLTVTGPDGAEMAVSQNLPLDCGGMSQGLVYKLPAGEYLVSLSGFAAESTPFSAAPVHAADAEHAHQDEASDHHHDGDPHFWFDPTLVVKYVENIRDGLIAADPQGAEGYTANAAAYIARLNELDAWIKTQVEQIPAERRLLVTDHETFGYFADRYGFRVVGAIVPSVTSGATPSAQEMAALVEQIRETGAPAIFLEAGRSPQLAQQIGAETGARVVTEIYTHSLTDANGPAPTYIEMMKHNVTRIVEALK